MYGAPGRNRTCDPQLRRLVLYPLSYGRRRNARHYIPSVPCAQLSKLVGVEGFEPPTPCSQSRCATRLRYTPIGNSRRAPLARTAPGELAGGSSAGQREGGTIRTTPGTVNLARRNHSHLDTRRAWRHTVTRAMIRQRMKRARPDSKDERTDSFRKRSRTTTECRHQTAG